MAVVFDTPKITGAVDPPRYTRYLVGKAALNAATVSAVVTPLGYALYAVRGGFALRSALRARYVSSHNPLRLQLAARAEAQAVS